MTGDESRTNAEAEPWEVMDSAFPVALPSALLGKDVGSLLRRPPIGRIIRSGWNSK